MAGELARGKPLDSACRTERPGLPLQPRPWRVALSEHKNPGESKGNTLAPVTSPCFVYIVVCSDGTFYVGSTSDLRERERAHNEGHGAEYTATRLPVRMVYSETHFRTTSRIEPSSSFSSSSTV